MDLLLHIAEPDAWDAARRSGSYRAASLDTEGFIHCSTPAQIVDVANRYYAGRRDLVMLRLESVPDVRWEEVPGGDIFPHVYVPIALASVRSVTPIFPGPDGVWRPRDFAHIQDGAPRL